MTINHPILVLGAGSWGTALALVLARKGIRTYLYDSNSRHIENLIRESRNSHHLPDYPFPGGLHPVSAFLPLPEGVEDIVIVVPCDALREVVNQLTSVDTGKIKLCLACKGLEPNSLLLNNQVVAEVLGNVSVAILSGPSFAREVAAGLPTAVTIASTDHATAVHFAERFHNEVFRVYTHDDVIGVQIGGAVKNVLAIAAGIADGLGFGANTRSALITRGLAEMMRLGTAMGGRAETFMGLTGLGDLVLTCTDDQSRNRRFGLALAKGKTPDEARKEIGQVIEGIRTAGVVRELAKTYNVEMPISEQVFHVLRGAIRARAAVQELLGRERKMENG